MKRIKILCVHGIGDHRRKTWKEDWKAAVLAVCPGQPAVQLDFAFVTYDDLFEKVDLSVWKTMQALWKLSRSGISSAAGRPRSLFGNVSEMLRWTAGYIVAWVEDDAFKTATRKRVLDALQAEQPDVILAHSLGSLVTYDAFAHPDARKRAPAAALRRARYVTLGSQLANPFVVGNLTGGRLNPLRVKHWHHLFNRDDDVLTAPIRLWNVKNFEQVETPFDIAEFGDHSPIEYLRHAGTVEHVWSRVAEQALTGRARAFGVPATRPERAAALVKAGRLKQRALLIGINQYPRPEDRLEGCVNDVFLMSSVLQECGFPPGSIRVCLDERATAKGMTDRLAWLLDDPRPGDDRVFYYSGHGATIPSYGEKAEPDRKTETLVPWDFDWSPERAVVDDQIFDLYSQLPYDVRLAMIFDCCHSGGMHRQGGPKARGLNPPDDIRHRDLKWDRAADMWVPRAFKPLNRDFSADARETAQYFGADGTSTRIGRASIVRPQTQAKYRELKRRAGGAPVGPYLPLIIEACAEKELSYEYRHGVTSYGAFTYSLALELRKRKRVSFRKLVEVTGDRLEALEFSQRPQILGPKSVMDARVPWRE